jgi:hypothetical protein
MPSLRSLIDPAGRSLDYHVSRLKARLDEMRERIRETAARLLGETVANVVEQTVRNLLTMPVTTERPPVYRSRDYRAPPSWADPDSPDYLYDPHDPHGIYRRDELDEPEPEPEPETEPEESPRVSRWRQALAIGLRAAAWWLQRWTGGSSLGVALGLGITATAVVLAGGPATMAGAGLLASALGLTGLVAIIHSGMAALAVPPIT